MVTRTTWLVIGSFIIIATVAAIESPTFRVILLFGIIAFVISMVKSVKQDEIDYEIKKEAEKKQEKRKNKLFNKLGEEYSSAIRNNPKLIATAYRKTVSANSFGKKNYDKFIPELIEFLEDQNEISELISDLSINHDTNVRIDIDDSTIEFIEKIIDSLDENIEYSEDMDPFEYEHYCAEQFNRNGWIAKATQGSSDQGVDVVASKGKNVLIAQCKKYAKPAGNKAVQEIVAGIKYYNANKAVVIATNGFTKSAEKLAMSHKIVLIHHTEIEDL